MARGSWDIYDEHAEFAPRNIARGTGRSPSQIAPAPQAMCARSGVRTRGVIDAAGEAKTAGRHEDSISDLFRAAGVRVTPARKVPCVPRFEVIKQRMVRGSSSWPRAARSGSRPFRRCHASRAAPRTWTWTWTWTSMNAAIGYVDDMIRQILSYFPPQPQKTKKPPQGGFLHRLTGPYPHRIPSLRERRFFGRACRQHPAGKPAKPAKVAEAVSV